MQKTQRIELKQIVTRVRPPRFVVFINSADPHWQHTCERIIEWFSQLWGGAYNFIIPTDGENIDPVFWKLLEIYQPDFCYQYVKTIRDLSIADPQQYQSIRENHIEDRLKRSSSATREIAEKEIKEIDDLLVLTCKNN
ncbi:MAG: hypothetical protein HYU64_03665 [Armatimonadetes bacterium]|nr:hypothetical protein [Armatimonadota bacterium]